MHFKILVVEVLSMFIFAGVPCITDCVMGELEKMGTKYRVALRLVLCLRRYPNSFGNT